MGGASSGGRRENISVFRVKNHDFTPKNHIFFNCQGRRENFWGISCEKSRFYAKKNHIFSNFRGGRVPGAPPPLNPPLVLYIHVCVTTVDFVFASTICRFDFGTFPTAWCFLVFILYKKKWLSLHEYYRKQLTVILIDTVQIYLMGLLNRKSCMLLGSTYISYVIWWKSKQCSTSKTKQDWHDCWLNEKLLIVF